MLWLIGILALAALLVVVAAGAQESVSQPKRKPTPEGWPTDIPFDAETKATPKKVEQIAELSDWVKAIETKYGLKPIKHWDVSYGLEKVLCLSGNDFDLHLECSVDLSGKHLDRYGKIEVSVEWSRHFEDNPSMDFDKEKTFTLAAAMKQFPKIMRELQAEA